MSALDLILFDVVRTVYDTARLAPGAARSYVDQFSRPEYSPLELDPSFSEMPAHPDAAEGIARLRTLCPVATLSNVPVAVLVRLARRNGIAWDGFVPIELRRVYKPDPAAYLLGAELYGVEPRNVLVVTANPRLGTCDYGDVEAARKVGMQGVLIRSGDGPTDINALADRLGCPGGR